MPKAKLFDLRLFLFKTTYQIKLWRKALFSIIKRNRVSTKWVFNNPFLRIKSEESFCQLFSPMSSLPLFLPLSDSGGSFDLNRAGIYAICRYSGMFHLVFWRIPIKQNFVRDEGLNFNFELCFEGICCRDLTDFIRFLSPVKFYA